MSIGLKSDSSGTSGSIVINGSDKVVVTSAGNVTAGTFTGAVVGAVTGNVTGNVTGSLTAGGSVTSGVAVASTSGTAIDFTSIPSWVKQITVMFDQVSTNGTSLPAIQLGDSGGVETSGYNAASSLISPSGISTSLYTASFTIRTDALSGVAISGHATLNLLSSSANTWAIGGILATPTPSAYMTLVGGTKSLSATLDRVRITTVGGTDTFDAGSVNILYQG